VRWTIAAAAVTACLTGVAGAQASGLTFYLDLRPVRCAIKDDPKHFLVVPCSLVTHEIEIYAVVHGGWGHRRPSASVASELAHRRCGATFRSLYGNTIDNGYAWWASGPTVARRRSTATGSSAAWRDWSTLRTGRVPTGMGNGTHFRRRRATTRQG
jgi:hypothetical protein